MAIHQGLKTIRTTRSLALEKGTNKAFFENRLDVGTGPEAGLGGLPFQHYDDKVSPPQAVVTGVPIKTPFALK